MYTRVCKRVEGWYARGCKWGPFSDSGDAEKDSLDVCESIRGLRGYIRGDE